MSELSLDLDGFHACAAEVLLLMIHTCPNDRLLDVAFDVKRELKRIADAEVQIKYVKRPVKRADNVIPLPARKSRLGSRPNYTGGDVA